MARLSRVLFTSLLLLGVSAAPAGAVLVYERPASSEIVAAEDDGTGARVVARGRMPALSPDGRRVAYLAGGRSSFGAVRIVSVGGGRPWTAVRRGGAIRGRAGVWTSDGRRVLAGPDPGGDPHLVSVGARTRRRIRVPGLVAGATFSPDGRRLLVLSAAMTLREASLFMFRLRDGRRREIRREPLPAWGPRGFAWRTSDHADPQNATYAAIVVERSILGRSVEVFRGAPSLGDPIAWSRDGARLLVPDRRPDGTRAIVIDVAARRSDTLPEPLEPVTLSRDGEAVLGEAGGNVVAQDRAGAVTVLATGATAPSWTR